MTGDTHAPPRTPPTEDDDPRCLRPGEAVAALAPAPWRRVVILGEHESRLARAAVVPGYRPVSWSDRVSGALRAAHPDLACRAARGRKDLSLFEMRSRQVLDALVFRGDLALISCGGPELRQTAFDLDSVEIELSRILDSLRSATYRHAVVISPFDRSTAAGPPADAASAARADTVRERQLRLVQRIALVTLHHAAQHIDLMRHQRGLDPRTLWAPGPGRLSSRGHAVAAAAVVRALARRQP
ncbi:hypothetical protein ACFW9L_22725 [Streptomyces sp. NPDC059517]|uniref:hypothetical protein n=1 Tax=Streptomyces sp. NPDC059517 TaxID=3346855 RepID=UPI0036C8249A